MVDVRANVQRSPLQPLGRDRHRERWNARIGLESRTRHESRPGSYPPRQGWRHLHHGHMERGLRDRRRDGRASVDLRSRVASRARLLLLLRRSESRRGPLRREGVCGNDRRPVDRPERPNRDAGMDCRYNGGGQTVFDYERSSRCTRVDRDRQRRFRVRRTRLRLSLRR